MFTACLGWAFLAILTVVAAAVAGEAVEQKTPAPTTAPGSPPAAEVLNLLPTLTAQLTPSPAVQVILSQLPDVSERIGVDLAGVAEILRGQPSLG